MITSPLFHWMCEYLPFNLKILDFLFSSSLEKYIGIKRLFSKNRQLKVYSIRERSKAVWQVSNKVFDLRFAKVLNIMFEVLELIALTQN